MGLATRRRGSNFSVTPMESAESTLATDDDRSHRTTARWGRATSVVRIGVAAVLGASLAFLWLRLFPGRLPDQTDIVGYPILNNFNVVRYLHVYNAITLVFPLAMLASFAGLAFVPWFRSGRTGRGTTTQRHPADEPQPMPDPGRLGHMMRAAFVGFVLGFEIAFTTDGALGGFWPTVLATALVYVGLLTAIASGRNGGGHQFWIRHAAINALVTPLTVAGLYGVSRASGVRVLADGSFDRYLWMPIALAAAGSVAALTWVAVPLTRARVRGEDIVNIERKAVMFLAGPVLLFLLVAQLPGALGLMDMFHEGELLAAARLTESGRYPWRELYFVHGPLQDVLSPLLGMKVFQESRWGATAGVEVLVRPAVAIGFYLLHARLFRSDWIMFAATGAIVTLGLDPRFLLLPFAMLLLLTLLRRPNPVKAGLLAALLLAQSVLTPEAAPFALMVGVVLVSFEIYYRDRERRGTSFSRTLWFAGTGLVLLLGWAGYLASNGALDDFLGHYLTFARDHELTGGIPIQWGTTPLFFFAVVAPVACVLLFLFFFAVQLRRDRLRVEDWVVLALTLYVSYYYRKFLSRADAHVFQVLVVSIPLVAYVLYRATSQVAIAPRRNHRPPAARPLPFSRLLSIALLLIVLVWTPNKALALVEGLPSHFRATASAPAWLPSLGYATDEALDRARFEDLREVLLGLPNPSGRIFDFTNQPAMFHYLLGYQPSTRYYHVSLAIRRPTQDDLLDELRRNPPGIVVFHAEAGLPGWDGVANAVRHYEISEYLLDHYRPVMIAGGNLLLLRNDLELPPGWPSGLDLNSPLIPQNLYFFTLPCDWGYAPDFLEVDPPPAEAAALDLGIPAAGGERRKIELLVPPEFRTYDWLEIRAAGHLRADRFVISDGSDFVNGGIHFRILEGAGPRYLVRVGSCLQWHGYTSGRLVLLHDRPQDIVAVRLLRSRTEGGTP